MNSNSICKYFSGLAAIVALSISAFVISSKSTKPNDVLSSGFQASSLDEADAGYLKLDNLDDLELVRSSTSNDSGENHSRAIDQLVGVVKQQRTLSNNDIRALLSFISAPKPNGLSNSDWQERVNSVLNALRLQPNYVPGLADFLLSSAQNGSDRILRLYALQHLSGWYPREQSKEKRKEIVSLLESLAKDGGESAGCAVLFLSDLQIEAESKGEVIIDIEIIRHAALDLVSNVTASQDVRISALHACAERGFIEVLPAAREIASDRTAVLPLRKAAVFVIGQFGSSDDLVLLSNIESQARVMRPSTAPAISKIQQNIRPK